jgi:hypothetical protein
MLKITLEAIKDSLIKEGIKESFSNKYSTDVFEKLKDVEYDEFYYRIYSNNKIYFFIRKMVDEKSSLIQVLNKDGFDIK